MSKTYYKYYQRNNGLGRPKYLKGDIIDLEDYTLAYEGSITHTTGDNWWPTLERLYNKVHKDMSIGDVVLIGDLYYYCQELGWKIIRKVLNKGR